MCVILSYLIASSIIKCYYYPDCFRELTPSLCKLIISHLGQGEVPPQMFSMRWGAMAPGQPNSIKREKTAKDWQLLVPKPRCSSLAACGKIGKHIFYIIFRQKWIVPCTNQTGASPKQLVHTEAGPQFHNGLGIEGIPLYNIYTYVIIINDYDIIITIIYNRL